MRAPLSVSTKEEMQEVNTTQTEKWNLQKFVEECKMERVVWLVAGSASGSIAFKMVGFLWMTYYGKVHLLDQRKLQYQSG